MPRRVPKELDEKVMLNTNILKHEFLQFGWCQLYITFDIVLRDYVLANKLR